MTTLNRRSDTAVAMELMAEALGTSMASKPGEQMGDINGVALDDLFYVVGP
jgi:hypothetical protein